MSRPPAQMAPPKVIGAPPVSVVGKVGSFPALAPPCAYASSCDVM